MFNHSLKKESLKIHKNSVEKYNTAYDTMRNSCDSLYRVRESVLSKIAAVEILINTIANSPKEFDKQLGEIKQHILKFYQTKDYAEKAYK